MCGRFTSTTSVGDLAAYFDADAEGVAELAVDFNVTPTRDCYIVRTEGDHRLVDIAQWGLVPQWAESPAIGSRLINARSETASSKPSFRSAFRRRRCLVPVDGFYEWAVVPGRRRKQPFHIAARNGGPLAFAGLWETWHPKDRSEGPDLRTCTILTGPANATIEHLHDRMPIILDRSEWSTWLDPAIDDVELLRAMLDPAPDDLLETWPVAFAVNDVGQRGPSLIERVELDLDIDDDGQARLF